MSLIKPRRGVARARMRPTSPELVAADLAKLINPGLRAPRTQLTVLPDMTIARALPVLAPGGSAHPLVPRPRGAPRRLASSAASSVAFRLRDSAGTPER